jgi:putative SOS response-associated peptidase YedK
MGAVVHHCHGDAEPLKALLAPYPAEAMTAWPVDKRVGNVRNNDPGLIEAVEGI